LARVAGAVLDFFVPVEIVVWLSVLFIKLGFGLPFKKK
jgi:hypothetical protein